MGAKRYFGAMLDCSRNAVMRPEEVINFAGILKSFGYNMIQLYTEETYEVENEPFFGYMRGRYSQQQLSYIVEECEKIGIEVIPCIQTLAHLNQIFHWMPYAPINDTADILLIDDDRTYELIDNMFQSIRKCFKSDYVHIGMDEAHMVGLGKFLDRHGYQNRFEILNNHLTKVVEKAAQYGFKPIMWSDMFFRLGNYGDYYPQNPVLPQEVIDITPKNVGLVYWDYYHVDKKIYDAMFAAHKRFDNEIWFAGGAWTWTGFASGNEFSMETMIPAMQSAKENGIENIMITLWGDDGKECSYYTVLPSLYAIRRIYEGETDLMKIKTEFKAITGQDYDELAASDLPNYVGGNRSCLTNISKYALYGDPFQAWLEHSFDAGVNAEYAHHAKLLYSYAANSKDYGYILETYAALCDVLSVKYGLGYRTREAYRANDKNAMKSIVEEYREAVQRLDVFYQKYRSLWYKENHPSGFDVQDLRIGGLKQRLESCRERLQDYIAGKINSIPELEGDILDSQLNPPHNIWSQIATSNVI